MDEAFSSFALVIRRFTELAGEFTDPEAGVHTYITALAIESAVELDISRDADGRLRIGTTPPVYGMMTSVAPSFHRVSFAARLEDLP